MLKKIVLLSLFVLLIFSNIITGLNYRFSYVVQGDVRKTMYLFYKFKLFYKAAAEVTFTAQRQNNGTFLFYLNRINKTGYRIRTHRKGKKLSIVTADYNLNKAINFYPTAYSDFRRSAPFYFSINNNISKRPFRILPTNRYSLIFKRLSNGLNNGFINRIKMVKPFYMKKYNDSFNIYKIMAEMLRLNYFSILPGNNINELVNGNIKNWHTKYLNYGRRLSYIILLADYKARKYLKFKQKSNFRLNFSVISRNNYSISLLGRAYPKISMGMGLKLSKAYRKVIIRIRDGAVIKDEYILDVKGKHNRGWSFKSSLNMI